MKVKHMLKTLMELNPEEEIVCIWYDKSYIEASRDKGIPKAVWEKAVPAADSHLDSECDLIVEEIERQVEFYSRQKTLATRA